MKCVAVLPNGDVCNNTVDPPLVWDYQLVNKAAWPEAKTGFYARVPLCPACMKRLRQTRRGKVA